MKTKKSFANAFVILKGIVVAISWKIFLNLVSILNEINIAFTRKYFKSA